MTGFVSTDFTVRAKERSKPMWRRPWHWLTAAVCAYGAWTTGATFLPPHDLDPFCWLWVAVSALVLVVCVEFGRRSGHHATDVVHEDELEAGHQVVSRRVQRAMVQASGALFGQAIGLVAVCAVHWKQIPWVDSPTGGCACGLLLALLLLQSVLTGSRLGAEVALVVRSTWKQALGALGELLWLLVQMAAWLACLILFASAFVHPQGILQGWLSGLLISSFHVACCTTSATYWRRLHRPSGYALCCAAAAGAWIPLLSSLWLQQQNAEAFRLVGFSPADLSMMLCVGLGVSWIVARLARFCVASWTSQQGRLPTTAVTGALVGGAIAALLLSFGWLSVVEPARDGPSTALLTLAAALCGMLSALLRARWSSGPACKCRRADPAGVSLAPRVVSLVAAASFVLAWREVSNWALHVPLDSSIRSELSLVGDSLGRTEACYLTFDPSEIAGSSPNAWQAALKHRFRLPGEASLLDRALRPFVLSLPSEPMTVPVGFDYEWIDIIVSSEARALWRGNRELTIRLLPWATLTTAWVRRGWERSDMSAYFLQQLLTSMRRRHLSPHERAALLKTFPLLHAVLGAERLAQRRLLLLEPAFSVECQRKSGYATLDRRWELSRTAEQLNRCAPKLDNPVRAWDGVQPCYSNNLRNAYALLATLEHLAAPEQPLLPLPGQGWLTVVGDHVEAHFPNGPNLVTW